MVFIIFIATISMTHLLNFHGGSAASISKVIPIFQRFDWKEYLVLAFTLGLSALIGKTCVDDISAQLNVRNTYDTFTRRLVLLETGRAKYWGILACIPSDGVGHHCLLYHYCQISFLTIIIIIICQHYFTLSLSLLSPFGHHYLKGLIVIQC